jgi:5-methylcytosine-specific restriction protein A
MPTLSGRRVCSGCHQVITGPCPTCTRARRAETDNVRGTSAQRGYGSHWRNIIRPAFLRDHSLCVICGALAEVPDHWPETRASLVERGVSDPDASHRLRALCKPCHDTHGLSYKPWATKRTNRRVTLVAGPPCAGKNTYVTQHAKSGEEVVDYDEIMARLSGRPLHHHDEAYVEAVRAERDQRISRLLASGEYGWIIASAPRSAQRHELRTSVVLLLPPQSLTVARAEAERPHGWREYVRQWYRDYEADERDEVRYAASDVNGP